MLKKYFVLIGIVFVAFGCSKNGNRIPEKTEVKGIMTLVCDYELKNTHLADDGMWRASLLDPVEFPMKESSGTAFFCFGMAWGINNGIL